MASRRSLFVWIIACAGLLASAIVMSSSAQEDKGKNGKQADAKAADKGSDKGTDKTNDAKDERYVVPTGGSKARLEFIGKLRRIQPKTRDEAVAHLKNVKEAAQKVIELEQDTASTAALKAKVLLLELDMGNVFRAGPDAHAKFYGEVKGVINGLGDQISAEESGLAMNTARILEIGKSDKVLDAYETFAKAFAKSKDKDTAQIAALFQGTVRRLKLTGNEMKIEGKTVDGKAFDWASYRGKVVLVDFWATWCGPCVAELPNVKRNYDSYHAKGFEVVGISLDQDKERLEKFLADEKIPWVTLHDEKGGGMHPTAEYYGIMGIPTVILVDKEGKVVSLNARGEALAELLAKRLGPAEKAEKTPARKATK